MRDATDHISVVSPDLALKTARAFLDEKKIDISRYNMSKPEDIQELTIQSQRAWRVSWKLKEQVKAGNLSSLSTSPVKCEQEGENNSSAGKQSEYRKIVKLREGIK